MSKFTFSFLIVDDQFQDTVSYEIEEEYQFEDVITHLCSSFNFNRDDIDIKSSLGFPIKNTHISVREIVDRFGLYFKLSLFSRKGEQTTKDMAYWEQPQESPELRNNDTKPTEDGEFNDVMDDLLRIRSENWEVDLEGNAEITVIPNTNSLITHLRVKFNLKKPAEDFFAYIAKILDTHRQEILVVVISERAEIVENLTIQLEQLLDQHGAVFFVYPENMREKVIDQSVVGAEKMKDLIFKYKSHNLTR